MSQSTSRNAFTIIELIFVIIVIGILAAIAIPKFFGVSQQAVIASGRSDVMSIRTAIATERQKRLMRGDSSYISHLDSNATATPGVGAIVFDDNDSNISNGFLLTYGITTKNNDGGWMKTNTDEYTYYVSGTSNIFDYNVTNGTFNCTFGTYCDNLTK